MKRRGSTLPSLRSWRRYCDSVCSFLFFVFCPLLCVCFDFWEVLSCLTMAWLKCSKVILLRNGSGRTLRGDQWLTNLCTASIATEKQLCQKTLNSITLTFLKGKRYKFSYLQNCGFLFFTKKITCQFWVNWAEFITQELCKFVWDIEVALTVLPFICRLWRSAKMQRNGWWWKGSNRAHCQSMPLLFSSQLTLRGRLRHSTGITG